MRHVTPLAALVAAGLLALGSSAWAAPTPVLTPAAAPAADPADNPWLGQRVMNMAHSGGEDEAPMNTMYAYKRAVALGSDMLEIDVQVTADGQLAVIHDATVDDTTDSTGRVRDLTMDELRALDAAYWFVPGESTAHDRPASDYPLRGARDGDVSVEGYRPEDFGVPALTDVLEAFPDTPINIEIKGRGDADVASFLEGARLLAEVLDAAGRDDVVVGSFNDAALAEFHRLAPQIPMSAGRQAMMDYFLMGTPPPEGVVAFQVPVTYSGIPVVTRSFVDRAHRDGYAVHAWFSGSAPDDAPTYHQVIDACVDGLMPSRPTLLEEILDARGIERPSEGGTAPRAECGGAAEPEPTDPEPTDPEPTEPEPTEPEPTDPPTPGPTEPTATPTSGPTAPAPTVTPPSPAPTTVTAAPATDGRPAPAGPERPAVVQTDGWAR